MFKIIASDGKQYGPVTAATLRDWLRQGRINGSTSVMPEGGTQWVELRTLAEFEADLAAERPAVTRLPGVAAAPAADGPVQRCGLAVASLVLGILGLFTIGITALVGLILGIMALSRIKASNGQLSGKGLALGGIVTSAVILLLVPVMAILAGLLLPALSKAKGRAQEMQCMNNMKQLALGVMMYSGDYKDTLPSAAKWCDLTKPYVDPNGNFSRVYACPMVPGQRCGYAFNLQLSDKEQGKVNPQTVLIFESNLGWNGAGGVADVAQSHPGARTAVAFADGHVEVMPVSRLQSLRWKP